MNREEKVQEISWITDQFAKSQIAVCVDYRGLKVSQVTQLRRELRQAGSVARVVKNTLGRISAQKTLKGKDSSDLEKFVKMFVGPTLVVYSHTDPIAPTKVLAKLAKDMPVMKIKGAFLDGQYVDPAGVDNLSKMPGREETLSMLLRLLNTPATNLARLLNAPGEQLVRVVDAQREKLAAA